MSATFGRGDRVAIGLDKPVPRRGPVYCPFHLAWDAEFFLKINTAGEGLFGIRGGTGM